MIPDKSISEAINEIFGKVRGLSRDAGAFWSGEKAKIILGGHFNCYSFRLSILLRIAVCSVNILKVFQINLAVLKKALSD